MTLSDRINILGQLGEYLEDSENEILNSLVQKAYLVNPWFTPQNIYKSLEAIRLHFLDTSKLVKWASSYPIEEVKPLRIGVVMAGNIPLVGFHDVLCSFIAGHRTLMKCSSKDEVLMEGLVSIMVNKEPRVGDYFEKVDRLQNFDAVIATGGDTAAVHFEYYFSKYPHIIRKNRHSVALLNGNESESELANLGTDIFDYFGLGCRSVSHLILPQDFSINRVFECILQYSSVIDHNKYKNNYDYNHAIYLLGQESFLTNGFVILKEDEDLSSRIACIHYHRYSELTSCINYLDQRKEKIQCICSNMNLKGHPTTPFGSAQTPALGDYADKVDTLDFLTHLGNSDSNQND